MDLRVDLGDRVEQIQRAHDVVRLGVDRVLPVDHRVRRRPLLGEVDDRVRRELPDDLVRELGINKITDVAGDLLARDFIPHA